MKCLLSDIEGLSAQIENLGNLGLISWTKPGATCSNLIDRAGFAATC
jgi:hypothetical protein